MLQSMPQTDTSKKSRIKNCGKDFGDYKRATPRRPRCGLDMENKMISVNVPERFKLSLHYVGDFITSS